MLPSQTEMNSLLVVEAEVHNMMSTLKIKGIVLDNRTPLLAAAQKSFLKALNPEEASDPDTSFASWEAVDEEKDRLVVDETERPLLEKLEEMVESLHSDSDMPPVLTKMITKTMTALKPEEETLEVLNSSTHTALEPETPFEKTESNVSDVWWNAKTISYFHGMTHHDHQGSCACQLCSMFGRQKFAWDRLVEEIDDQNTTTSSAQYHVEKYENFVYAANKTKEVYDSIVEAIEERKKINHLLWSESTDDKIQAFALCGHCGIKNRLDTQEPWLCDCCLLCDKAKELERQVEHMNVMANENLNISTMTVFELEETVNVPEAGAKKIIKKKDNQATRWREQLQNARSDPSGDYNDLLVKMREEMKSAWF